MAIERWKPHVTVATVVENDGDYLLVKEAPEGKIVYNQPAGHLDEGESLVHAAYRETLEETGWEVEITHYLGSYRYIAPNGTTYLRHGFCAKPLIHHKSRPLDQGIEEAVWMSYEEICQQYSNMRSPMVKQIIDDYRQGEHYPLAVLHEGR